MRAQLNALRFALRAALGFRRGRPPLVQEPKDALFDYLDAKGEHAAALEEAALRARYRLEPLAACSTRFDYRDNLYVLEALETVVGTHAFTPRSPDGALRVVDVGSKNFNYAFALERFFRRYGTAGGGVSLLGVEVDGHVVYRDLYARCDYADAYAKQTGNPRVGYRVADFCTTPFEEPSDITTLLFPFVTRQALVRWGLPVRFFEPERLLQRALETTPQGHLLVFSQTESERDTLVELLSRLGASTVRSVPLRSRLVHYHEAADERFATLFAIH